MIDRIRFRRRAVLAVATGTVVTAVLLPTGGAGGQARDIDWKAVGKAIGQPLKTETGGVHTAEWLRTDLRVVNAGVTMNPGMELGAEALFRRTADGRALLMGEVTLKGDEVDKVADRLQRGGVEITALHKHLQDETPRLWWLHFWALGDPVRNARTIRAALALTGIPLEQERRREPAIALNRRELDRIIGAEGDNEHGVLQYHIPLTREITDTRAKITLPSAMDMSQLLMFQPLGGGRAAINGDFIMTADQVNPVIKALRSHGLTLVELHNHWLYEQPRLFYMHFWATGDATGLARALRAGLDQVHAPRRR
jgi:Domain of Unknown Function (DUF1259)